MEGAKEPVEAREETGIIFIRGGGVFVGVVPW